FSSGVTLTVAQSNTLSVNDTVSTGSTGASNAFTVNPGAINNFLIGKASGREMVNQPAGPAVTDKVTERHQFDNVKTDYAGTVHFAVGSADAGKTPPADCSFVADVNGVHPFSSGVTLTVAQSNTLSVNDTVSTGSTGASNAFTVNPGAINNF